jgi:two-component system CheB/CheR fusion protein
MGRANISRHRQGARRIHKRRILVVDENRDAAAMLGMILKHMGGHHVDFAYDGISGLEAAHRLRPDIIFLDLAMPGMEGYEVASQLRRDPQFKDVLIIAVTGSGHDEARERTREAGFDHHLLKPVDPAFIASLLGVPAKGRE